jgi:acetylglutamate synthase
VRQAQLAGQHPMADAVAGAENTNWRTQVFRAILERQCVLESERGSACVTRETRKQRGVVGVRLEPRYQESLS